jgi:hypothetical protein
MRSPDYVHHTDTPTGSCACTAIPLDNRPDDVGRRERADVVADGASERAAPNAAGGTAEGITGVQVSSCAVGR